MGDFLYGLRGLLSLFLFGAALGLTAGIALGVGNIALKALTYNNKKDKKLDYEYSQYADKSNAFVLS